MFLDPILARPGEPHRLTNADRGTVLAACVEAAFDPAARNRGLLGRDGLAEDSAMVIAPSNSIHMFFMRFPIDAVFVARDGRVVKTCAGLRPWRIAVAWRAFAVIEGAVGMIERTGTRVGDRIEVVQGAAGESRRTHARD